MFLYGIALIVLGGIGRFVTRKSLGSAPGTCAALAVLGAVLVCTSTGVGISMEVTHHVTRKVQPVWQAYVTPARHSYQKTMRDLSR